MALTTRTEYALRALLEIADKGQISAQKICDNQRLPKKYIEHLLSLMKAEGIVISKAGSQGGYSLAKKAEEISFYDVLDAVEDSSFVTECSDEANRHCIGPNCSLSFFFSELEIKLQEVLKSYSLQDIFGIWKRKDR